jgi:hypothetical protein
MKREMVMVVGEELCNMRDDGKLNGEMKKQRKRI